jgi:hypothetical protein
MPRRPDFQLNINKDTTTHNSVKPSCTHPDTAFGSPKSDSSRRNRRPSDFEYNKETIRLAQYGNPHIEEQRRKSGLMITTVKQLFEDSHSSAISKAQIN